MVARAQQLAGSGVDATAVDAIRAFNRFYTRIIGALAEEHLESPFSLAEVRLLFEIAHRDAPTAATLVRELGFDAGYLSRLVRRMTRRRLVKRTPSTTDGRESYLSLTPAGSAAFKKLEARTNEGITTLLAPLAAEDTPRLLDAMARIHSILAGDRSVRNEKNAGFMLRAHRPGDMGWVVQCHGTFYATEYQWDERFEALVAHIVADFIDTFDPKHEHCWIAEQNGVNVGSVFLVRHPERDGVAKLRLLLVDPAARGLGIGHRLVNECTRFARRAGYHTITLWTNDILLAARRIYEAAGYTLINEDRHHSFGHDLTGQTWELKL
jgi:DNA-binding MarR family transcriptional regulator/GNAT superfamily N-acetyltransferase